MAIIKGMGNGKPGIVSPENSAQFQIYLASAGSYEEAKATERDILTTDLTGYAKSKEMPYGTYVFIRQLEQQTLKNVLTSM